MQSALLRSPQAMSRILLCQVHAIAEMLLQELSKRCHFLLHEGCHQILSRS